MAAVSAIHPRGRRCRSSSRRAGLGGVSKTDATRAYRQAQRALTYTVTRPAAAQAAAAAAAAGRVNVPGTVAGRTVGSLTPEQALQVSLARDPNNDRSLLRQQSRVRPQPGRVPATPPRPRAKARGRRSSRRSWTGFYANDLTSTLSTIASIQSAGTKAAAAALHLPGGVGGSGSGALRLPGQVGGSGATSLRELHPPSRDRRRGAAGVQRPVSSVPQGLQVDLLRSRLTGKSMVATLKAVRAAARKALRTQKLSWEAQTNAYNAIIDVNQQLGNTATQFAVRYRRSLRGTQPAYAAAAGGVVIHGGLHLHGIQDVTQLENELEARAKRRPRPRRGR